MKSTRRKSCEQFLEVIPPISCIFAQPSKWPLSTKCQSIASQYKVANIIKLKIQDKLDDLRAGGKWCNFQATFQCWQPVIQLMGGHIQALHRMPSNSKPGNNQRQQMTLNPKDYITPPTQHFFSSNATLRGPPDFGHYCCWE